MKKRLSIKAQEAAVIFPHQLFETHPALARGRPVFLVEDQLFFHDFHYPARFHKKKLILHRASLRAFYDQLKARGFPLHYLAYQRDPQMNYLFQPLQKHHIGHLYLVEPVDYILEKRLHKHAQRLNIKLTFLPSPGFLTPVDWLRRFFNDTTHYSMTSFYIAQRKRLNILLQDGKPLGGKWSFDPANRRKLPKDFPVPRLALPRNNKYIKEATTYVEKNFPHHPGSPDDFFYPVTHKDAGKWLRDFLTHRFRFFGDFQDAIAKEYSFLFHSLLTPMLNIGLLTPQQIDDATLAYAQDHQIPLNSLEGFLRQIIGWREFMRAIYILEGVRECTTNFWKHSRKLPPSFYNATTGIEPVDSVITRLLNTAYAHHIERLMVLGNFMLLCEIDPDQVYQWFMELFIDAYDWVMVPNVYGMSQYADGGLITTKPYISSSNYLKKMSDFPTGEWCEIWDALYWRFIHTHRTFFSKNPRMKVMTMQLTRMGKAKLQHHLKTADKFLQQLHVYS